MKDVTIIISRSLMALLLLLEFVKQFFDIANFPELVIILLIIVSYFLILKLFKKPSITLNIFIYLFIIFLIILTTSSILYKNSFSIFKKLVNRSELVSNEKYYEILTDALMKYSKREYKSAEGGFKKAIKLAPKEDIKDIYLWLAENYSREGKHENSYKTLQEYYSNYGGELTNKEKEYLTYFKLISLLNTRNTNRLEEDSEVLLNMSDYPCLIKFNLLAKILNEKKDEFKNKFDNISFDRDIPDNVIRDIEFNIWSIIIDRLDKEKDQLYLLVSLMLLRKANPELFDESRFIIHFPLVNYKLFSLAEREEFIHFYNKLWKYALNEDHPLFSRYKKELVEFGLEMGSPVALIEYLKDKYSQSVGLLNLKINDILNDEFSISFEAAQSKDGNLYILWVTGEPIKLAPFIDDKLLEKAKFRLIKINKKQVIINQIGEYDLGHIFFVEHFGKENIKFLLITRTGSGEYNKLDLLSPPYQKFNELDSLGEYVTYHSHDTYTYNNDADKIHCYWKFELWPRHLNNIERKVFGELYIEITEDAKIISKVFYPNPALEFFERIEKEKTQLETYLLGICILQNIKIIDKKFISYIVDDNSPPYIRSNVDETYHYIPSTYAPKIAILLFGEDINNIRYIALIKRYDSEVNY